MNMRLNVWSGDFGLPSIHYKCLQMMAYAKFCGAPIEINYSSPSFLYDNNFPSFDHENEYYFDFTSFVKFLNQKNIHPNNSSEKFVDTLAHIALLDKELQPIMLYQWWVSENNYIQVTRPCFAQKCKFPGNLFVPGQMQRNIQTIVDEYYPKRHADKFFEIRISEISRICLRTLSERLGSESEYFGGQSPNALDAFVFGYLAPILKVTFPAFNCLQNHLKEHHNLVRFVEKILAQYFPNTKEDKKTQTDSLKTDAIEQNDKINWFDLTVSGLFAIVAMAGYALASGIVQIQSAEEKEDDEEMVDETDANYQPPTPILEVPPELLLPTPESDESEGGNREEHKES